MPSKTKRKYRGGDPANLERCKKWVKSNDLADKQGDCEFMEKSINFPVSTMFSKGPPPVTRTDIGDISSGTKLNFLNWDDVRDGLKSPVAKPAPVVNAPLPQLPQKADPMCTAYDRTTGRNVLLKEDGTLNFRVCDSSRLPKCTQWKAIDQGSGFQKLWATTGPNGEFCNVAELPMDDGSVFSKLHDQKVENVNMDRDKYPLRRPRVMEYASGRYKQYLGGKKSRRKTRKSRR